MIEPVGVLGRIAADKREELARRYDGVALDALRAKTEFTSRSLTNALTRAGARFILEIKKSSPSEGALRVGADVATLARGYAGVADALSVLCDRAYFGGSPDDLSAARTQFDGPILAKDFFLDLRQVAEARIAGADAVLVMLSLLDDPDASAIIAEARRFGMEALVEVHDEGEMRRALAIDARLIGINNRDLRDLSIDLSTTERLARMAPDKVLISESGIKNRDDVDRLARHVDAFLVGSSLMRSAQPSLAARELVCGRVKLCGLKRDEDIQAARMASFAGFVFAPDSPRNLNLQQAAPLAQLAQSFGMLPVGVFRDASVDQVALAAEALNLHAVQLHGGKDEGPVRALRDRLPDDCEVWTAVGVGKQPLERRGGDRIVFDNDDGGSGKCFDWSAIAGHPELKRAIVAGGIGAHNAAAAQRLGAYAIDIGSAVDESPGHKSPDRMAALFETLRPDCRQRLRACA